MPFTALRPTLLGALSSALAMLLGLAHLQAQGLGLGRPIIHSSLGKPLDASIPLTLADGEQLTDACVRAEVAAGDVRVPAGLLQLRTEGEAGQRRIRLQSEARIDEPALRITLALGCPLRLTREFNVLVDPADGPGAMTPPAAAPAPSPAPRFAEAPPAVRAEPVAAAPAPAAKPRKRAKPRASGPRLVLERPEVLVAEAPLKPAATAEMELTPELEAQIAQLEQTVAELRAELLGRQQAEAQVASAAPAATVAAPATTPPPTPAAVRSPSASPYRDPMTWLLTLALSLLAGSAAFYFSRWRDERARRELAYWRALHAAEGAGLPPAPVSPPGPAPSAVLAADSMVDEGRHEATRPQPRPMPMPWPPASQAPVATPALPSMQATQPLPVQPVQQVAGVAQGGYPPVADELLDLQQQIDFLQLLGQQDAAADLLATRLARGQAGAMPHLLLMELCQQRGDTAVFAELARQFEQRFGGRAPQWSQSLSRGRALDACPSVIAHLQMVWADPAAAMKMLHELLAQGRGPGVTHFELPAYRDLLTLYSVARDLFEAGLRGEEVDLMLPLDSSFGS